MDDAKSIPVAIPVPIPVPTTVFENSGTPTTSIPRSSELEERQTSELMSQGYTRGMTKAMGDCVSAFSHRMWIVDNSGSMSMSDGNRMIQTKKGGGELKSVSCTRWKEIQETVEYHIHLASLLQAPTTFRLLNNPGSGPQIFSVATTAAGSSGNDVDVATDTMRNASPSGVTPLSKHIREIQTQITTMAPDLNAQGCKVAIVLATDGLPTDSSGRGGEMEQRYFLEALRSLEGLPVWIVVRLCTDDDSVVQFYNELDGQLELSIEVLDNYISEAEEIYEHNKWINYTLPLHRMREMGFQHRIFDLLDERALTIGELKDFCILIFGADAVDRLPDPEIDFHAFLKAANNMLKTEKKPWHPIKKTAQPLIDVYAMNKVYGEGSSCTIS